jgi:hypothetical protein
MAAFYLEDARKRIENFKSLFLSSLVKKKVFDAKIESSKKKIKMIM